MDSDEITASIDHVRVRRVWDSRGRPTVEVEIGCGGRPPTRAIAPSGASTGGGERLERRDGGHRLGGNDVTDVVAHANEVLGDALLGRRCDVATVDAVLDELDPVRAAPTIGGNVMIATSLAVAWAAAAAMDVPLWRSLAGRDGGRVPLPEIQIIGGGAHAHRALDLQDLMVVAPGATSFAEALEWTTEVHLAAGRRLARRGAHGVADEGGFWPVFASNADALDVLTEAIADAGFRTPDQVAISIDVAATQLCGDPGGRTYRLALDARELDRDGMIDQLAMWCREFPIVLVEDPLHEDDIDGHAAFRREVAPSTLVVGDDLLVTDPDRIDAAAGAADVLLLKPNQVGTVTGARLALDRATAAGMRAIASARSGESEDVSIVHLAVGWSVEMVKVGSVTRGERTAKWNELLRISESVPDFAGRAMFA